MGSTTRIRAGLAGPAIPGLVAALAFAMALAACGGSTGSSWTSVGNVPDAGAASIASVATDGAGFVAVGQVPESGGQDRIAAWTSPDGKAWTAVALQAADAQGVMVAVAHRATGYMAVACGTGECVGNSVWTSADGTTWQQAAAIGPFGQSEPVPMTVAPVGSGWLAGGWHWNASDTNEFGPAIWTSTDGSSWSEAQMSGATDASTPGGAVAGITAFGPGVVAVGSVTPAAGRRAAAWTSIDGTIWTPVPDDAAFAGGLMSGIAAAPSFVVAVGRDGDGAAVWTSTDGTSWVKSPAGPGFAGASMTAITAQKGRFVAVGSDAKGALAWTSTDGKTWALDATGDAVAGGKAMGVAAGSALEVAVGSVANGAAIWTRVP